MCRPSSAANAVRRCFPPLRRRYRPLRRSRREPRKVRKAHRREGMQFPWLSRTAWKRSSEIRTPWRTSLTWPRSTSRRSPTRLRPPLPPATTVSAQWTRPMAVALTTVDAVLASHAYSLSAWPSSPFQALPTGCSRTRRGRPIREPLRAIRQRARPNPHRAQPARRRAPPIRRPNRRQLRANRRRRARRRSHRRPNMHQSASKHGCRPGPRLLNRLRPEAPGTLPHR